jgi:transposase
MSNEVTYQSEYTPDRVLYMAMELSERDWKLGFTTGLGQAPRFRTINARDLKAIEREISLAKHRFGLPDTARVLSCYEAGREGFWIHRYLLQGGVENLVVDAASIEVRRRRHRVKTDRVDLGKLVRMLVRYHLGDKRTWSVVRVPSVEAEDRRQLHRERWTLVGERTRHICRINGLVANLGVRLPIRKDFLEQLDTNCLWDGAALPNGLKSRLIREYQRLQWVGQQIEQVEEEQRQLLRDSDDRSIAMVRDLIRLRGINIHSAWPLVMELFSWRAFCNGREIGGLVGLVPDPYQSGETEQDQGISKKGNSDIRALVIELAWRWLFHQPGSKLSRWYQKRFAKGSRRVRKIGIVALARKLLIDLWRYLETGEIPEGAVLKSVTF